MLWIAIRGQHYLLDVRMPLPMHLPLACAGTTRPMSVNVPMLVPVPVPLAAYTFGSGSGCQMQTLTQMWMYSCAGGSGARVCAVCMCSSVVAAVFGTAGLQRHVVSAEAGDVRSQDAWQNDCLQMAVFKELLVPPLKV